MVNPGPITVPVTVVPAVPATTPAWLLRLVSLLLPFVGVGLDVWNPSHKLNTAAAQAAVVVVFLLVAAVIFIAHVAIGAIHEYGFHKSAAGAFLAESGPELRALIAEAKPLVEQARPALDAVGPLSNLADRVGEVEHRLGQVNGIDRVALLESVRQVLGGLAAAPPAPAEASEPAPAVVAAPEAPAAPAAPAEAAPTPVPGAPVTTALNSSTAPA